MWLSLLIIILFFLYAGLIFFYYSGWHRLTPFIAPSNNTDSSTSFTVIVPARNESAHIRSCLESLLAQSYPADKYEIIIVDDFSTDDTAAIVSSITDPRVRLIRMEAFLSPGERLRAPKKKAIEIAIGKAKGEWIVTTDADCIVPVNWLYEYNAFIHAQDVDFIAAPVAYITHFKKPLEVFQSLDFMSLQGITGAAAHYKMHVLCNGANISYKKAVFEMLGGFTGIDHIASGDDMLLMQKFYSHRKESVGYLFSRDAIVRTYPMPDIKSFLHQRIRWASKSSHYKDPVLFLVLLLVYLFNLSFIVLFVRALFDTSYFQLLWMLLISKTLAELYFLFPVASFFGKIKELWWFFPAQPFHIIYTVVAGFLGKFGSYQWKGRTITSPGKNVQDNTSS